MTQTLTLGAARAGLVNGWDGTDGIESLTSGLGDDHTPRSPSKEKTEPEREALSKAVSDLDIAVGIGAQIRSEGDEPISEPRSMKSAHRREPEARRALSASRLAMLHTTTPPRWYSNDSSSEMERLR